MSEWVFALTVATVWVGGSWFAAAWLDRYLYRRRVRRLMAQMTADLNAAAKLIGDALIPAIRECAEVFTRFAKAWDR